MTKEQKEELKKLVASLYGTITGLGMSIGTDNAKDIIRQAQVDVGKIFTIIDNE